MKQIRYLAFLDILGFKDLIDNNSLEDIVKLYSEFEPSILESMKIVAKIRGGIEHPGKNDTTLDEYTPLNSLFISDSIVLWTDNDSQEQFIELLFIVKSYLLTAMKVGFPLRGAITSGELSIVEGKHNETIKQNLFSTILGKPLTKAYVLEKAADWSGCIIDQETIVHFEAAIEIRKQHNPNLMAIKELILLDVIKLYKVPMKSGKIVQYHTVNWTHFFDKQIERKLLRAAFSSHNKRVDSWQVENKIRNIIDYYNSTKKDIIKMKKFAKKIIELGDNSKFYR